MAAESGRSFPLSPSSLSPVHTAAPPQEPTPTRHWCSRGATPAVWASSFRTSEDSDACALSPAGTLRDCRNVVSSVRGPRTEGSPHLPLVPTWPPPLAPTPNGEGATCNKWLVDKKQRTEKSFCRANVNGAYLRDRCEVTCTCMSYVRHVCILHNFNERLVSMVGYEKNGRVKIMATFFQYSAERSKISNLDGARRTQSNLKRYPNPLQLLLQRLTLYRFPGSEHLATFEVYPVTFPDRTQNISDFLEAAKALAKFLG